MKTRSETGAQESGEVQPAPEARLPSLWRSADYANWWTSNTLSALGTSVSAIAYPLLVLYTTGSVAQAGLISAASLLRALITTLWGGALADRISRNAILVCGQWTGPLIAGLLGVPGAGIALIAPTAVSPWPCT